MADGIGEDGLLVFLFLQMPGQLLDFLLDGRMLPAFALDAVAYVEMALGRVLGIQLRLDGGGVDPVPPDEGPPSPPGTTPGFCVP